MQKLDVKSRDVKWAIRSVNGRKFPNVPATLTHEFYVIDKDSERNMNGDLVRNKINEKNKFILKFPILYTANLQEILSIINKDSFVVEYEDFFDRRKIKKGWFYHGDLKKTPKIIKIDEDEVLYEELSFNLIEY